MSKTFDVVIIGAGPAGCAAAYEIARHKRSICLVEKLGQIGGLSRTIERNGARYDIGPHRFFTKSERVLDLWKAAGKTMLIEVPRLTRILYKNRLLHYPLQPMNALMGLGIGRSMHAVMSYVYACSKRVIHPHEPQSFEEWISDNFGSVLYESFFKTYTEKVWGISCKDIASTWASQRIKGLNLTKAIFNAFANKSTAEIKTLVDKFIYPRNGSGTIYENMVESVLSNSRHAESSRIAGTHLAEWTAPHNAILFNSEVTKLFHNDKNITGIEVVSADGTTRTLVADAYICTMPLTDLILRLVPAPPQYIVDAARALLYRTHISVNILVEGVPFPDNWIYVHNTDVKVGRIANYRNFSSAMTRDAKQSPLTFEYFVFDGDGVEMLSDSALIDLALREGRSIDLIRSTPPRDAFVVRNPSAYCVIKRGYERHCAYIQEFLRHYENFQTVGRAGMFKYNNQDHSIMTAILAVDNLVANRGCNLWNVNIDAEYHESGTSPDLCVEDREEMTLSQMETGHDSE